MYHNTYTKEEGPREPPDKRMEYVVLSNNNKWNNNTAEHVSCYNKYNLNTSQHICIYKICKNKQTNN